MKIFNVYVNLYDFVCSAKTFHDGVYYLIEEYHYFSDDFELYNIDNHNWSTMKEVFGSNWKEKILSMSDKEFTKFFNFYDIVIEEVELYERKNFSKAS